MRGVLVDSKVKHVVSYSGGLGSFMSAKRVIDEHGPEGVVLLFTDTLTEDEDLYRFLDETTDKFGIPLTRIADGRNIWEVFNDVRYMGNNRIDPCSRILKRELARKWMQENHPDPDKVILYVGIGWDEEHRMKKIREHWSPYRVEAPLTERPYLDRKDIIEVLDREFGIEPVGMYADGFPHANCGGFCIKTGQAQFKLLYEKYPDRYRYHEEEQEKLFEKIGPHGFIRMTVKGKLRYLSLREFREHLEANRSIDLLDYGGCGCFV